MALVAACLLASCLPDGVKDKDKVAFMQEQAASHAAALASYASISENNLVSSAAFQDGSQPQGLAGTSSDRSMSYGYCRSGSNHMIITWYRSSTNDDKFSLKSLGTEAGNAIVQELGKRFSPHSIGFYEGGKLVLRGPRSNGSSQLTVPSSCSLDIADGAPVILVENMAAPGTGVDAADSYVYKTEACPNNEIGLITYRCKKTAQNGCAPDVNQGWSEDSKTCNGAVSSRSVSIAKTSSNDLVGALDINGGALQNVLNRDLKNVKCREVKTEEVVGKDKDGKDIKEEKVIANSCDTENIAVKEYEGVSDTTITNEIVGINEREASCSGVPAGSETARLQYNGTVYSGVKTFAEWTGKVEYRQNLYRAEADVNDASSKHGESTFRGPWWGHTLNCSRAESIVISCNSMFPQYRTASRYEPVSAGGVTFRRTNKVVGWKDSKNLIPNDSLSRDAGWTMSSVSCSWDELRTFTCSDVTPPNGVTLTLKRPGVNKRRITATKGNFANPTIADWRKSTTLQCENVTRETEQCSSTGRGFGGGGSRGTSGSSGANNGE